MMLGGKHTPLRMGTHMRQPAVNTRRTFIFSPSFFLLLLLGDCRECFSMAIFALISACLSIIFENGDEIYAVLRKCSTSGGGGGVYLQHVVYVVM